MTVKLKDIAKKTGVSISTVSRILSNDPTRKSSSKTAERVLETARQMGYQPLPAIDLGSIKGQAKQIWRIGCILTSDHETFVSPFFSTLLAGIQKELANTGNGIDYHFFVINIIDPGFPKFLDSAQLDCAIMLGRTSFENFAMLQRRIPNLVYAGVNRIDEEMDEVICDAFLGASCAVEHLISLGHKNIGYIGPTQQKHQVFNEHRYRGYLHAMETGGLAVDHGYIVDTILTSADGYQSMRSLIDKGRLPTAIFCGNDTVALGVMCALNENGLSIPGDISLIGFDNIDTAAYVKPALTTISVPTKELGRLAVKVLLDKLETGRTYTLQVTIPFTLVERESCRKLVDETDLRA